MAITAKLVTDSSITIIMNSKTYILTEDNHQHYSALREALKTNDIGVIEKLIDMPKAINAFGQGHVKVLNGVVYYHDKPMHNALTTRMLRQMNEGFDVNPLVKFMENLMGNPSMTAREELYLWLEANNNPITDDGHFIAFKRVRPDYKDHHSGTIDNSIGQKPAMERSEVDDNRMKLCSVGLHFAAESYIPHFHGNSPGHTMVLKINPADVVSIPADYDNAKGRCWQYEVIGELDSELEQKAYAPFYATPVHATEPKVETPVETKVEAPATPTGVFTINATLLDGVFAPTFRLTLDGAQNVVDSMMTDKNYTSINIVDPTGTTVFSYQQAVKTVLPTAPTVTQVNATPAPAVTTNQFAGLHFTRIQACAILGVSNDQLTTMLADGTKVKTIARGGKNWVEIL